MPSADDKASFDRLRLDSGAKPVLVPKLPPLPDDVRKRFPSLEKWQQEMEAWRTSVNKGVGGAET